MTKKYRHYAACEHFFFYSTVKLPTLYAMQYIIGTPIEKLYTFVVTEEVLRQLGEIVKAYLDMYVGRSFKSLEILETII